MSYTALLLQMLGSIFDSENLARVTVGQQGDRVMVTLEVWTGSGSTGIQRVIDLATVPREVPVKRFLTEVLTAWLNDLRLVARLAEIPTKTPPTDGSST